MWLLPVRGRSAAEMQEPAVEGDQAERILKEDRRHADAWRWRGRPPRQSARRWTPQRVEGETSAMAIDRGGARLFELADDERREVGERRLRPVDRREAIAGLPVAQPDEVEAGAVRAAAMIADRHLAHALEDDELDLGDVRQVDERRDLLVVPRPHGIGTRSMMSLMTASVVSPWLAACGPSQMRWLRMYGASSWMSSG